MAQCNVAIAGKGVTADGSIIFLKTEDAGTARTDFAWQIPRKQYPEGAVVDLFYGGTIPQVSETYAWKYFECPTTPFSSAVINEWGVILGSNGCSSRVISGGNYRTEEEIKELEARGELKNGGIGTMFRIVLAERCKTAREAVLLGAELLDEYGYWPSGRNLNIVGPNEAWTLQMATGKHYVARRVQDDEVFIIANTFNIHEVDLDDKENFIASPDLVEYAIERGWYDPASGKPFDWAFAYAPPDRMVSPSNTQRHWNLGRQLSSTFMPWEEAAKGWIPTTVKPDNTKLTPQDMMNLERTHLEGTVLDLTGPEYSEYGYPWDPHTTPSRPNCQISTIRTTVYQSRDWLPPALQLVWLAPIHPCSSVLIPWYVGMTETPEAWRVVGEGLYSTKRGFLDYHFDPPDTTWEFNYGSDSACNVFGLLAYLVDSRYDKAIDKVQETWAEYEKTAFALQNSVEDAALALYEEDPDLAKEYLTLYSFAQSEKAIEIAKDLINDFRIEFWGKRK